MAFNFQREEEVQEYVKNIGIEYRFSCYKEKKPEVCHLLGDYFEAIKKEFENAAKVYKNNCDDYGHAKSCMKYGNYVLLGKGGTSGESGEALNYFEKGCDGNNATACLHAGLLLTQRSGEIKAPKTDIPKGFNYLKKGCDNGADQACYYLSGMYIKGVPRNVEQFNPHDPKKNKNIDYLIRPNMEEAFKFANRACDLGNIFACANVSMMYKNCHGVEKNEEKSQKYKKLAQNMQEAAETTSELKYQQGLD